LPVALVYLVLKQLGGSNKPDLALILAF
jgi:hypothetical protein